MATASKSVADVIAKISTNKSSRFSKSDYQELIYALIVDDTHTFEKFALSGAEVTKTGDSLSGAAKKFFKKLLKHAGLKNEDEINSVIDTFEFSPKDVEWVSDVVDEAIRIYTESGNSVTVMKNSIMRLSFKKVKRSGKYDGQVTYRRSVKNLEAAAEKAKARGVKAGDM